MTVKKTAEANLPTRYGKFRILIYEDEKKREHTALIRGEVGKDVPCLVRVHSQCLTGDTLGSKKCDCGEQLDKALQQLSDEHRIVVLLHDTEGYKLAEIEALTGIPVGTVKSRLHRARARLREILVADGTIS